MSSRFQSGRRKSALHLVHGGKRAADEQTGCDLASAFDQFVAARQRPSDPKPLAPKTIRSYSQAFNEFCDVLTGCKEEGQLAEAIKAAIDERIRSGTITASGMNVYLRGLNAFFSWCLEFEFLKSGLKIDLLPVERRQRPRTLTAQDVALWSEFPCATFSQMRTKCIALLVLDTGVRIEECLLLRHTDIEWKGSRLWIDNGKGGSNRAVPLSTSGAAALRRYLSLTAQHRPDDSEFVFCTESGTPLQYRNTLRDLKAVADRLGMRWVGWHSFRRTFATHYVRNGGLLTNLQQILGHADLRTTVLYLGDEIEEIVAMHDSHSPLALVPAKRKKHKPRRSSAAIAA